MIRPEVGIRGVRGRGKIDGDGVTGQRPFFCCVAGKKFRDRKTREPHQVSSGARAVVVADDFDSHFMDVVICDS
jgi:hypothetical protein